MNSPICGVACFQLHVYLLCCCRAVVARWYDVAPGPSTNGSSHCQWQRLHVPQEYLLYNICMAFLAACFLNNTISSLNDTISSHQTWWLRACVSCVQVRVVHLCVHAVLVQVVHAGCADRHMQDGCAVLHVCWTCCFPAPLGCRGDCVIKEMVLVTG